GDLRAGRRARRHGRDHADQPPRFHLVDAAAMHLGAAPFSVYNTYSAEQVEHVAADAESRVVVTERAFLDTIRTATERSEQLEHIVVVDGEGEERTLTLDDIEARADEGFDFEAAWSAVEPDDVLTLIYTSGTTGPPKGVQITHANMLAAARSFDEIINFPEGARVISYLPMAHIAERACTQYLPMTFGFSTTDCPDPRQIAAYLPEVRPTWWFSVPRVWEKLKAGLEASFAGEEDENRKAAIEWALDVGRQRVRAEQAGEELPDDLREQHENAENLVLSKIREKVGLDQIEACNVGAAPTPPETIEFFHSIGVPLAELWGMSETCGAGTCNRPGIRIGTVGEVSPGVEAKLGEDGELLVRGDVVMKGYRNMPEQTAEAIDDDGWLHTGDVAEIDDGYVRIIDRKKELIINAAGKNMSPANIEAKLKAAGPLIGQAVCVGDRRPYNVALVTLDPDIAPGFARQAGIDTDDPARLAQERAILDQIEREIDAANEDLARVEQIKRFKVLEEEWQPGGDELTPTMKLKRKPIAEKYGDEIEALYAG
ncbi:MAG TPA: long-chain fatty acid--CoA ligase, partial [Thermoleophilaceae bacterium]|nr:long-chain fatty acid--CoA ligase [Thermoleophilaceae bacterium]